jgi:predicted acyl esterase
VAGPVTLSPEELARNRADVYESLKQHPLDDAWHRARSADLSRVTPPLLTCANWGGQGIHPRGNFNGFVEAPARQKWLEVHGDSHWSLFYSDYGVGLQKRFFDHFLKGFDNGWERTPRVMLNIRHPGERFVVRHEHEWPLARTRWTRLYLDPAAMALRPQPVAETGQVEYDALGDGVTFSAVVDQATEITGPIAARLFVSSSTRDADLFLIVRVFDPRGRELTFMGSIDPNTPIANGWLRASHRRLDSARSAPYRPYHPHDRVEPLAPGEVYECDVEIVPSCIVIPAGWRLALTVRGKDYESEGELGEFAKTFHYATRGTGGMTHDDPDDRPKDVFDGQATLHAGGRRESSLLLPIIPPAGDGARP